LNPSSSLSPASSFADVIGLRLMRLAALAVFLIVLVAPTSADPDLWGHIRFGRDIVAAGSLHREDPYSFTSDRPWINHEWLAEVLIAVAYSIGGTGGLVSLKTIIVGLVLCCIVASLRSRAWKPVNHDLLIAIALIGMFPRYHPVRPQLFSLLMFALLLLVLQKSEGGNRRLLPTIPLMFAAWANLHGGFLVGLGVLGIWLVAEFVRMPRDWPRTTALGAATVTATLLTPYGFKLWSFLGETVGLSRAPIKDWQPALMSPPIVFGPWLLVVATAGWALWRARGRGMGAVPMAIVLALAAGSARVGRLDAFLAISVVMLLGPTFGGPPVGRPEATFNWPRWAVVVAIVITVTGAYGFNRRASCLEMRHYPEPEATAFLEKRQGRLLTFFDWGEYAIWHLAPRLKVSMDGRRETVYSETMIDLHLRLYKADPTALDQVVSLAPDLIWLPVSSPAIVALERRDWKVVFRGPLSVILSRQPEKPPVQVSRSTEDIRCFPDR
jgi:hypothetical protein